jgi:hypothetical protein
VFTVVGYNGQQVWTGREPTEIDYSADAGNVVSGLTWSSWTTTQAVGNGTWTYDDCLPDCASGSTTPYPATITLSGPVSGAFTHMTETTSGPHGFTMNFTYPGNDWALGAS